MTTKMKNFEETFAYIYCRNGMNGTRAWEKACEKHGKKIGTLGSMAVHATAILKRSNVQDLIALFTRELKEELSKEFIDERKKIIESMWNVYNLALSRQKLFDRNGKELDGYSINSVSGANKSLELLAKATGLLIDKVETKNDNTNTNVEVIEIELE